MLNKLEIITLIFKIIEIICLWVIYICLDKRIKSNYKDICKLKEKYFIEKCEKTTKSH